MKRREFLKITAAGVTAGFPLSRAHAQSAEFNYKYANNLPLTHPMNLRAKEMVDAIRAETKGRVDIQVFPNNQLGSDTDMLSQLRSGALEFFTLSGLILSTLVPAASITGIGFAFADYDAVWKALDGELGAYVRAQISKAGIVPMDKIWDNGFRQITSSTRPIVTADDLKGFKIRVPVSPLWGSLFQHLGASPTSINFAEVYSALQTHIVDGQENPLSLILITKIYEVQKYISITNHMWDGQFTLVNGRVWQSLPENLQEVLARNFNEAAMREHEDIAKVSQSAEAELTKLGLQFHRTDPEVFRAAVSKSGYYKKWRATFGEDAWTILEKYSGPLS